MAFWNKKKSNDNVDTDSGPSLDNLDNQPADNDGGNNDSDDNDSDGGDFDD